MNRIVIIGCSFRDLEINKILIDFLKNTETNKIIVLSPDASKRVKQNLLKDIINSDEYTRLNNQIDKIDKQFDNDSEGEVLDRRFNSTVWRRY